MVHPLSGDRTRVHRLPEYQVTDAVVRDRILTAGRVAHLGIVDDDQPFVLPVAYAPDLERDRILVHGSTASRLFRSLGGGAPACLTVTFVDGLVVARAAFELSMQYRSVMVLGRCTPVPQEDMLDALRILTEHQMPGRWDELRQPHGKEVAATSVLALGLDEWSVKANDGFPTDADEDLDAPVWAGVVPIETRFGTPVDAPDLGPGRTPPPYLAGWTP
jgi:nitroimidazol reductase NimA-like FMN-containing flavoprotein (pyridoxamine 5'-phosphate oxidase superfamily)